MNACYTTTKKKKTSHQIDLRKGPIKILDFITELKEKSQKRTANNSQTTPLLLKMYLVRRVLSRKPSKSPALHKKVKLIYNYSETEFQTSTASTTTTRKITRKVAIRLRTNSNLVVDLSQHQTNNFRLGTDLKKKGITINIVLISPQKASQLQGLLERKKS